MGAEQSAARDERRPRSVDESPLLRLIVEHAANALFVVDLETGDCLYVSAGVRALLGHEPEDLIGRSLTELIHPDDTAEVLAQTRLRVEGSGGRVSVSRMLDADEQWTSVQATASRAISHEGRMVSVFTVSDAAERLRAELGLRASHARLRRLLAEIGESGELARTHDGMHDLTVEALAAALALRDDVTCQHARRVTELALELTAAIDPELAAHPELRYGYLLHDIGKLGVPEAILLKPTPLTERELRTVQMHTALGEHLVSSIPFLSELAHDVIAYHHERWDGDGYPWGLRGESIPLAARIFAVVDAFDAITGDRPYRPARTVDDAIAEIERCAGTQFDPRVVDAFVPIARRIGSRSADASCDRSVGRRTMPLA